MNHPGGSSCVDEILKPARERKYELRYSNLACEHPGTFLIKAVSESNRGCGGGEGWGVGVRIRGDSLASHSNPKDTSPYNITNIPHACFSPVGNFSALRGAGGFLFGYDFMTES